MSVLQLETVSLDELNPSQLEQLEIDNGLAYEMAIQDMKMDGVDTCPLEQGEEITTFLKEGVQY